MFGINQGENYKEMKTSIKKNIMYQVLYEILVILTPLITAPIVSRALGPECSGIYSYTYSIAGYFVLVCMLGIKNHGSRIIAEKSDNQAELNRTFSNLLFLHIAISIIVFLIYIAYVLEISSEAYKIYALLQGMYVLSALFDISWFYIGIEQFKITVIRNVVIKLLTILLIVLLVKTNNDLWKYVAIMAGGVLVSQIWLWFHLNKYVRIVKPDKNEILENMKPLLILFVPVIAVSLYKMMDKIMIGWVSKTELGYYEYAEKIIAVPMSVIEAIGVVMLPRISKMFANGDEKESKHLIKTSMKLNMILAVAMAFGVAAISKEFAPVFFGVQYTACATLMTGLSITIPFLTFANVLRKQFMIPMKMDRAYTIAVFCGAVVNFICNLVFIPRFYAKGAMIGTIFAEVVVCVMHVYTCRKDLPIKTYIKNLFPYLGASLCMYLVVRVIAKQFTPSIVGLAVEVAVGGMTYAFLAICILFLQKDEMIFQIWYQLKKIFRRHFME